MRIRRTEVRTPYRPKRARSSSRSIGVTGLAPSATKRSTVSISASASARGSAANAASARYSASVSVVAAWARSPETGTTVWLNRRTRGSDR